VNADRAIDIGIALSQAFDRSGIIGTDADTQKMTNAARPRSIQGRIK